MCLLFMRRLHAVTPNPVTMVLNLKL